MIYKTNNSKLTNNIIEKKSTIKNDIILKMYNEVISISNIIFTSITSLFNTNNTNKIIEKKTSVNDGLNFHLHRAIFNSTHEKTTSYLNDNKQSNISRQAYENRSLLFDYLQLKLVNDNLFINNSNNKDDTELINYIDGTNINIYDKTNKNGYRNIDILGVTNNNNNGSLFTNNIDLNKNSEINLFYKLINNNDFDKNEIIVVDRYYFSKKFIKTCNDKKLKFIARIKSNSSALDKFYEYIKNDKKKINYNPFNYKFKYNDTYIKIISFKSNNNYIHLATNIIKKNKTIDYFKTKYGNRWNVEIYFKHIKKNSSINKITSHKLKTINNKILSSSINQIIIDRIISIFNKFNDDKKKAIDITNFYNLYADKLMYKILNNNISYDEFRKLIIINISFYKKIINKEKTNIRYSIMPYTKWHYKYIINLDKKNDKNIVKDDKIK
jgi:hypothetical protein